MKKLLFVILFISAIFVGCENDNVIGVEEMQTDNVIKFWGKITIYQDNQIIYNNSCFFEPPIFYPVIIPVGNYIFNIQYSWSVETENQFIIAFNNSTIFIPCNQNYQYLYYQKVNIQELTEFTYGIF